MARRLGHAGAGLRARQRRRVGDRGPGRVQPQQSADPRPLRPGDLRTIELIKRPWRNNKGLWFELAENRVLSSHLAELAPGGNSVRHRHTTEAVIYIVKGRGYSIVNYEGEEEQRIDWQEGTLFSPPVWAWHQHFNADPNEPARYLAIQDTGLIRHMRFHQIERHPTQLKEGGGLDYSVDAVPAETRQVVGEPAGEQ